MKKRYKPVDHITVYYAIKYTGSNIEECLKFDNHVGKLTNQFEVHSNEQQWAYDQSYLILIQNQKTIHFIAPSNWLVKRCNGCTVNLMVYTDEQFTYNFKEEQQRVYENVNYSGTLLRNNVIEDKNRWSTQVDYYAVVTL